MKNVICYIIFCSISLNNALAQITIGCGEPPHESAVLELKTENNDKGFLGPKVALIKKSATIPVSNPATGLLVYNTNDSSGDVAEADKVFADRFYYWNGNSWVEFLAQDKLEIILKEELEKSGIPKAAIFSVNGKDIVSSQGNNIFGIRDFLSGEGPGGSRSVPLSEVVNTTEKAVAISEAGDGVNCKITFQPGVYSITFNYDFMPYKADKVNCTISSCFMDLPIDEKVKEDRVRLHSNTSHGKQNTSQHGNSINLCSQHNSENQLDCEVRKRTGWQLRQKS